MTRADWRLDFSPIPFLDESVQTEVRRFNVELEEACAKLPPVYTLPPEVTRKARREGRGLFPLMGPLPEGRWHEFEGAPGGPGRLRIFEPEGPAHGLYLHIHGGGWVLGAPDEFDAHNQELARAADVVVASVAYRLAPEHPWPAAVDDCEAALRYVLAEGAELFGTDRVVIGGESAGAHLAALTLLRVREEGLTRHLAAAVLTYGCFDLRMTPSVANWGDRLLVLSTPVVEWFIRNFIPDGVHLGDPAVSPLLADLSDMPPALFSVGTVDPLLDDSIFMASRWAAAGAEAELGLYPGGIHAFDCFDLPITGIYRQAVAAFLRRHLV